MITLQEQIKDLEDSLERIHGYRESKEDREVVLAEYSGDITLADLILWSSSAKQPYDNLIIRGYSEQEDSDGWSADFIRVSYLVEEMDEEYFERLCSMVTPTEYQQQEYNQYLRLKVKYG